MSNLLAVHAQTMYHLHFEGSIIPLLPERIIIEARIKKTSYKGRKFMYSQNSELTSVLFDGIEARTCKASFRSPLLLMLGNLCTPSAATKIVI